MNHGRPTNIEEYVHLVDRAINEVDEQIIHLENNMEASSEELRLLNPILESLEAVLKSMADGSYEYEDRDLPFMEVTNKITTQYPFSHMLAVINETHRKGLNAEG